MTQPDPFAFVLEALGVAVEHQDEGPQGPGYYLQAPEPEWLGKSYTAAYKAARELVREAEPAAFDWIGVARSAVSLLDTLLPPAGGAPAAAAGWIDDDDLPDDGL